MEPQPSTGSVKEKALSELEATKRELEATERELATTKQELKTMKNNPTLIKLKFDDPTLSDITIKVGERSVHLHRIVLSRGSAYFSKCLAKDRFKEGGLKEVKLQEDDLEAMMRFCATCTACHILQT